VNERKNGLGIVGVGTCGAERIFSAGELRVLRNADGFIS
jgi:hypothetical protein